mgnify:CR=1 FL=1
MNILERIATFKKREVALREQAMPLDKLELLPLYSRSGNSLKGSLGSTPDGIIAEHKRRSPSKESINFNLDLSKVVSGYQKAGAAGISVLTDTPYFGGSLNDLLEARSVTELPLLRKDFTIDPYQIHEAKAFGADCILLIAAILSDRQLQDYTSLAQDLGMEVLLEVHDRQELKRSLKTAADIIGVNNRNLKTFEVSLTHSAQLAKEIPSSRFKISESGIYTMEDVGYLKEHGFQGFLIGERFMREDDPGAALNNFIDLL